MQSREAPTIESRRMDPVPASLLCGSCSRRARCGGALHPLALQLTPTYRASIPGPEAPIGSEAAKPKRQQGSQPNLQPRPWRARTGLVRLATEDEPTWKAETRGPLPQALT